MGPYISFFEFWSFMYNKQKVEALMWFLGVSRWMGFLLGRLGQLSMISGLFAYEALLSFASVRRSTNPVADWMAKFALSSCRLHFVGFLLSKNKK